MNKLLMLLCVLVLAGLSAGVSADSMQIYKWTDPQGVVHYSDKPPAVSAPERYLLNLPKLPPVDPKKIAATDAWIASINEMVRRQQAQDELAQQQRELAQQAAASQPIDTVSYQPAPIYIGYVQPQILHHHDRNEFRHIRYTKQRVSTTPTWPFPYNLNESSFPEEWHKP
jgi:Domain of unknown function (DUF4124)